MTCEFNDGLRVEYSDSLHVTMGDDVNVFVEHDYIPANIKHYLNTACEHNSCEELRKVAEAVTNTVGRKACFADMDSKACENF
ncbi:MAG: hypothetical protein EG828_05905 [Deltaproteobacteria bacterium]|nr:hypothetical protein [Deltaproteobacteria bacterium]